MLNTLQPKSLLSGSRIDLDKVLKPGSKHEYHHIFPKKHLADIGVKGKEVNCLANFCFLTRSDNVKISASSPEDYGKLINENNKYDYLQSLLIPEDFELISFEDFINKRSEMLTELANKLMDV